MKNKQSGFSLVELSVVLAVISITLGGALDIATRKTESDKIAETNYKMDVIEEAINTQLINRRLIPCPANGGLASSSTSFGNAGTATTAGCSANSNFNNSGNVYAGTVPTVELEISPDFMFDAWGRRFTYIVDYRFSNNEVTNPACDGDVTDICFKYVSAGSIRVNDSTGQPRTLEAVYVLISHGKNGKGAWPYIGTGARVAASSDASEQSNAGNDAGSFDNIFVQKNTTTTFDDIVRYRTKWQMIDDVRGITDNNLCKAALQSPATNVCSGATSTTICQSMAAEVEDLCFDPPSS